MNSYWHLSGDLAGSKVKSFTTAGKNGKTTVRIEIEITDPWEVGSLLRQLQEAQTCKPAPPPEEPAPIKPTGLSRTLALPAPSPRNR